MADDKQTLSWPLVDPSDDDADQPTILNEPDRALIGEDLRQEVDRFLAAAGVAGCSRKDRLNFKPSPRHFFKRRQADHCGPQAQLIR